MHRQDHRARAEEQQRLEESVGEQVKHAHRVRADTHGDEHVAELRASRISDDALDVVLNETHGGGEDRRGGADEGDEGCRGRRQLEQRRQPRHHEHAGGHHGGGVNKRRDRRRALHGVGQPGVQAELRRLAHGAHEQQQADHGERVEIPAQEVKALADQARRLGEDGVEVDRAGQIKHRENAERKAEVANAVDDECFDGGGIGFRLVEPEADQEIARQSHALPAEEHLHQIVGRHQHQHGEGEERQIGKEPRPVGVLLHVADGVDVHEGRDGGDHDQHHRGQ
jgi:hypothetical protein